MSGKKSVFLDVDSNLLEKNLLIKEGSDEIADFENFLRSPQSFSNDDAPWKLVTPTPDVKMNIESKQQAAHEVVDLMTRDQNRAFSAYRD